MTRRRWATALLVGLALGLAALTVLGRHGDRVARPPVKRPAALTPPDYARAVAANYTVLSPRQSKRLLGFVPDFRSCLARRGLDLGTPMPSATKIVLPLPKGTHAGAVVQASLACGDALGGPPPGASVQLQPKANAIVVYLPKYCLLDPKVARAG